MYDRQLVAEPSKRRFRSRLLRAASLALLWGSGCQPEEATPPEESSDAAGWRSAIDSKDPHVRLDAANAVLGAPGSDGSTALARLMGADPDPRVRERAVLAYGELRGREATGLLEETALNDESSEVVAAALASLHRIREEHPEPPRGWLDVELPETFEVGRSFPVHVRFGSTEAAPRVRLELQLPRGLELDARSPRSWSGDVVPGQERLVTFTAVATVRELRSGARVHLKLDYPKMLDVEVLHERVRVAIDGDSGHFEPQPAPVERAP